MQLAKFNQYSTRFLSVARKQGISHALRKTRTYLLKRMRQQRNSGWSFAPYQTLKLQEKPYQMIRVASVLDEFSELAWGEEFSLVPITPGNFERILSKTGEDQIDLVLVESAWRGSSGSWYGHIVGPEAPSEEIKTLVECARSHGIPTVFWNKEDPAHFEDFINSAKLFDSVFTTDGEALAAYKREVPGKPVGVLPFAAQPAIHNPVVDHGHTRSGDFVFGGTYFAEKFPQRREQTERILDAAVKASRRLETGLAIYSRFGHEDPKYRFPRRFRKYEKGFLPYDRMVTAYKNYKVVLNVNTVPDSTTMCSRRIFEAAACGAVVVSTEGEAIRRFFSKDEIVMLPDEGGESKILEVLARSPELTDRIAHRAQREIWDKHTYTHRARQVVQLAGITPEPTWESVPEVSVVSSTNRPEKIEHLLRQVAKQKNVRLECHVMLHGVEIDLENIEGILPAEVPLHVYQGSALSTLGENLNFLSKKAQFEYIAKFDDDDLYGANYLRDQVDALNYSGADVVGKRTSYIYLEGRDIFALRNPEEEHCFTDFVAGPTLVWRRDVTETVNFPRKNRGEDSSFLYDVTRNGMRIFSSDRFNFVQMRSSVQTHTWDIDDFELLASSKVIAVGSGCLNIDV